MVTLVTDIYEFDHRGRLICRYCNLYSVEGHRSNCPVLDRNTKAGQIAHELELRSYNPNTQSVYPVQCKFIYRKRKIKRKTKN